MSHQGFGKKTYFSRVPVHLHITESASLYLTSTIRTFALALVGIYLPIFIFTATKDYILFSVDPIINGLIWVLLYYMVRSLTTSIATTLSVRWIFNVLKFKRSIVLASVALIVEIILWFATQHTPYLILIAGVISGLQITFYWIPYHIFFDRKAQGKDGHFGKEVGFRMVLNKLANVVGPIVGGVVISLFGFSTLFTTAIFLILVSILPLLLSVTELEHGEHDISSIYRDYLFNKKMAKITLSFIGASLDGVVFAVFWPIVLFFVLDSFVKVGLISSGSMFLSMVAAIFVGKVLDSKGPKLLHAIGVAINTLLYIPRMVLSTPLHMYVIDISDRLNSSLYGVPFSTQTYEKGKRLGTSDFFIYRELALHIPLTTLLCVIVIVLPILPDWRFVFMFAMIGSLLTYGMTLDKQ